MKNKSVVLILFITAFLVILTGCLPSHTQTAGSSFTIGGAIYKDLKNPMQSGVQGVTVEVAGKNGTFTATTAGFFGIWKINDVPEGVYTITPSMAGKNFEHVVRGKLDGQSSITITVNASNQAANQSILFWQNPLPH